MFDVIEVCLFSMGVSVFFFFCQNTRLLSRFVWHSVRTVDGMRQGLDAGFVIAI